MRRAVEQHRVPARHAYWPNRVPKQADRLIAPADRWVIREPRPTKSRTTPEMAVARTSERRAPNAERQTDLLWSNIKIEILFLQGLVSAILVNLLQGLI